MAVTIKDIAKEAKVSTAAVSKALNNKGRISLLQKRKIERIAEAMGYISSIRAGRPRACAGSTKYIGVISGFADEYLIGQVQKGIESNLRDSGYYQVHLFLMEHCERTDDVRKERFLEKILKDKPIAGFLTMFVGLADATVAGLHKQGIPVVQLNNYTRFGKCVYIDNEKASYEAAKSLIKLGRRKIGLIMPEETSDHVWMSRLNGYKKALSEAKIPYNPYLMVYEHQFTLREAAHATKILLQHEPATDAVIYGSDTQAYAGLEALKQLNKSVPDDVAVLGFDNLPFSRLTSPPLTSVEQPMFEMGKKGSEILLDAMKKKDFSNKSVTLRCNLIIRNSTHKNTPKEQFI